MKPFVFCGPDGIFRWPCVSDRVFGTHQLDPVGEQLRDL